MVKNTLMDKIRKEELEYMKEALKLTEEEAVQFLTSHDNFTVELGKLKQVEAAITIMVTTAAALALHRNVSPTRFFDLVREVVLECAVDRLTSPEDPLEALAAALNVPLTDEPDGPKDADTEISIVTWQKAGDA
jgi:hypothetical protein